VKARDNPFSVDRIERIRYRPFSGGLEDITARLDRMQYRAAIVGDEGSGKTTLLEDLREHLQSNGVATKSIFINDTNPFVRSARRRFISNLNAGDVVLLDGAEAMGRLAWTTFKRGVLNREAGLVITAHRPGLMPTLIQCSTTPALLREIVADLLSDAANLEAAFLDELYRRNSGNIRNCLRELYDLCADAPNHSSLT